jgi:hypothetical protein
MSKDDASIPISPGKVSSKSLEIPWKKRLGKELMTSLLEDGSLAGVT